MKMNEKRDLVRCWFVNLIMGTTVVFPFLLAVVCAVPCFFGGWSFVWEGHDYDFYFLPHISRYLFGGGLFLAFLTLAFVILSRLYCAHPKISGAVGVFLLVLLSRVIIVAVFGGMTSPISDFAWSWERACRGVAIVAEDCQHHFFPWWMNYSMFEYSLVSVFGEHFIIVLVSNAVFDAVTAAMIYFIAFMLFRCRKVATIASLLYACYPPSLVYVLTATPEHFCIACFTVVAGAFIAYVTRARRLSNVSQFFVALLVGVVAGLGNLMKPILPIFLVAMSICLVVDVVLHIDNRVRRMWMHLLVFGCFFAAQICTYTLVLSYTESLFGIDLSHVNPTPHCVCVGLNRQGEGQIHLGPLSRQWSSMMSEGCPREKANQEVLKLIVDDWRGNMDEILPFLLKKMVWAWQDDNMPFKYFIDQTGPKVAIKLGVDKDEVQLKSTCIYRPEASQRVKWMDVIRQSIQTGAFIWYFVIMILGVIGVVWCMRTYSGEWHYAFIALLILGYACMIVLSEAQSRYKCLIMPYVLILIAPLVTKCIIPQNKES